MCWGQSNVSDEENMDEAKPGDNRNQVKLETVPTTSTPSSSKIKRSPRPSLEITRITSSTKFPIVLEELSDSSCSDQNNILEINLEDNIFVDEENYRTKENPKRRPLTQITTETRVEYSASTNSKPSIYKQVIEEESAIDFGISKSAFITNRELRVKKRMLADAWLEANPSSRRNLKNVAKGVNKMWSDVTYTKKGKLMLDREMYHRELSWLQSKFTSGTPLGKSFSTDTTMFPDRYGTRRRNGSLKQSISNAKIELYEWFGVLTPDLSSASECESLVSLPDIGEV